MWRIVLITFTCLMGGAMALWLDGRFVHSSESLPVVSDSRHERRATETRVVSPEERLDAIARAQVWRDPAAGNSARMPPTAVIENLSCRFILKRLNGTTPKFNCLLDTGEEVRIKYGSGAEIPAEAAATRLLRALGFGADEIALVHHLRCYGCPLEPFATSKAVQIVRGRDVYEHAIDYDGFHDFEWVALERKYDAWPIEAVMHEGWAFAELDHVDASKGGAPRAQLDALRLVAVFLEHWDNKADNQRLVCDTRDWPPDTPCPAPLMMLQDLGATFGPRKVNLRRWSTSTIWADRTRCRITMRHLPYSGATFVDTQVTEEGRQLAARLFARLTADDVADLFRGARFDQGRGVFSDVHPVARWVDAFNARVDMIRDGPPCPPV
jgi:hypothetical protein